MPDFDTGVFTLPTNRPSVFTPPGTGFTITPPLASMDSGVATTPAARANISDDVANAPTVADPGDILAG